jgi:hypothetical protein
MKFRDWSQLFAEKFPQLLDTLYDVKTPKTAVLIFTAVKVFKLHK